MVAMVIMGTGTCMSLLFERGFRGDGSGDGRPLKV